MKRLINWLKFYCVWSAVILSLVVGVIVFSILNTTLILLVVPTEKDFSDMESQITEIQESPEILFEPDRFSTIEDGLINIKLTNKKLNVQFDKDYNVISKPGSKEAAELKLFGLIISGIISLFAFVAAYKGFTEYYAFDDDDILEYIKCKIKGYKQSKDKKTQQGN